MSSGIQNIQNYIFNPSLSFSSHFFILLSPLKKPADQQQNRFQLLCALRVLSRVTKLPHEQVYTHPLVRSLFLPLIFAEGLKLKHLWLPVKALHALEAKAEQWRLQSEVLTVSPTDFC